MQLEELCYDSDVKKAGTVVELISEKELLTIKYRHLQWSKIKIYPTLKKIRGLHLHTDNLHRSNLSVSSAIWCRQETEFFVNFCCKLWTKSGFWYFVKDRTLASVWHNNYCSTNVACRLRCILASNYRLDCVCDHMKTCRALSCSRREDLGWNNGMTRERKEIMDEPFIGKRRMIFIAITLCDSIIAYIRPASQSAERSIWRTSRGTCKKSLESKLMDTINWMLELKNNQAPMKQRLRIQGRQTQIFLFFFTAPLLRSLLALSRHRTSTVVYIVFHSGQACSTHTLCRVLTLTHWGKLPKNLCLSSCQV